MSIQDESQLAISTMPASLNGKRKRNDSDDTSLRAPDMVRNWPTTAIQVITGSYERVLHGFTVALSPDGRRSVTFTNNFLFNAHAASIRCVAVSPPSESSSDEISKRILATGGSDERINIYQISDAVPIESISSTTASAAPFSSSLPTASSPSNRELGTLLHHNSTISALCFTSRGKLLSASYDNNLAVTRVRDWTVLSTIHAPVPKPAGRPSGDTASSGEVPAGINAIAVHPSAKLCLTVGQGERCMRLWNLVSGKKAGVLNFDKKMLALLGEGRWRGGEGRQIVWSEDGTEFAIGFERGALVYNLDCTVKGFIQLAGTKLCQIKYMPKVKFGRTDHPNRILVLATEDGRIFFYDTNAVKTLPIPAGGDMDTKSWQKTNDAIPSLDIFAVLGSNVTGPRIKDFDIHVLSRVKPDIERMQEDLEDIQGTLDESDQVHVIITGSSSGVICLYLVVPSEIQNCVRSPSGDVTDTHMTLLTDNTMPKIQIPLTNAETTRKVASNEQDRETREWKTVGTLLGTFETGRRITCLTSFVMGDANKFKGAEVANRVGAAGEV